MIVKANNEQAFYDKQQPNNVQLITNANSGAFKTYMIMKSGPSQNNYICNIILQTNCTNIKLYTINATEEVFN